jgi:hypothetical protein
MSFIKSIPFIMFAFFLISACSQIVSKADFESRSVLNVGKSINTENFEGFPMILPDGLTMYFSSDRPGGLGDLDIYVTHRPTIKDSWDLPVHLESSINSIASDHSVTISPDGHYMYFTSEKDGGFGDADLYMSYRKDIMDDFGWGEADNLGELVNSDSLEACPLFHHENGETLLYFVSGRENGLGGMDLYYSSLNKEKNEFQKPTWLKDVSSPSEDMHFEPVNGLIWSDRDGGIGQSDIWIATYDEGEGIWKDPICLKFPINTEHREGMPSLTQDYSELYFHSNRPDGIGSYDIYYAIMEK